jgi:hypothetical protein
METVDYLKSYGLAFNEEIEDWIQGGKFERDEERAFGQEIPRNPSSTPVSSGGTPPPPPCRINVVG